MKKRKELDALVANGKAGTKRSGRSGSCSAHELLKHDTDSSDLEDFSILQPRRGRKKNGSPMNLSTVCLPICQFVLVTTCVLVSGSLVWLHIGLREDLDILRAHIQKVEARNKNTPEALHGIHTKLRTLDTNLTSLFKELKKNIADIDNATAEIARLKETTVEIQASIAAAPTIKQLPEKVQSLSGSVAGFGSKINALESTVKELKESQSSYQSTSQNLYSELDSIKAAVQDLSNVSRPNASEPRESRSSSPLVRDLTIQNAIQDTNQQMEYLQKELRDLVRSVNKINSTFMGEMAAVSNLPSKVDSVNNALIWIANDTHSQNSKVFLLENYAYNNLTLRLEHLEADSIKVSDKPHQSSSTELKQLVNKTITDAVLKIVNIDLNHNELLNIFQNSTDVAIGHAHSVLMLLAGLIREFHQLTVEDLLSEKNATEIVANMLNNTLSEMILQHDVRIQNLEAKMFKSTPQVHDIQGAEYSSTPITTESKVYEYNSSSQPSTISPSP